MSTLLCQCLGPGDTSTCQTGYTDQSFSGLGHGLIFGITAKRRIFRQRVRQRHGNNGNPHAGLLVIPLLIEPGVVLPARRFGQIEKCFNGKVFIRRGAAPCIQPEFVLFIETSAGQSLRTQAGIEIIRRVLIQTILNVKTTGIAVIAFALCLVMIGPLLARINHL